MWISTRGHEKTRGLANVTIETFEGPNGKVQKPLEVLSKIVRIMKGYSRVETHM